MKRCVSVTTVVACAITAFAGAASAQVRITEFAYQGNTAEYIEVTNTSGAPVSLSGWSFDDNSRTAGSLDLSSLGSLLAGESAVICDIDATTFRSAWNLAASVKVLGGNAQNLSREDEMNIYDGTTLVDRLTYGDQTFAPGTIRTNLVSGITTPANWSANSISGWFFSAVGDSYGSYTSVAAGTTVGGQVGSPGIVPAPGAFALVGAAGLLMSRRRR